MNQIYIHNVEPLYLKEGFPERPTDLCSGFSPSPRKYACESPGKNAYCPCEKAYDEYKLKLQSSIDKALRFEDKNIFMHIFVNHKDTPFECQDDVKDGAYKLPDGWRVVEQWQYKHEGKWVAILGGQPSQYSETQRIARLVPVEKQEKEEVIEKTVIRWEKHYSDGSAEFTDIESANNFNYNLSSVDGLIATRSYMKMKPVNWHKIEVPEQVNTTASDKTGASREIDFIIEMIDKYWSFDSNQQHTHTWHDKQELIEQLRKTFPN